MLGLEWFGWLVLVAVLAALAWLALTYNRLVALRTASIEAWSQIDVQLRRRQDLVPSLVEAAKGYMAHERDLMDEVARRRAEAAAAGEDLGARAAAEGRLSSALDGLLGRAEAYPQLKASEPMVRLQEDLTSTEGRIAFARRHMNNCVRDYNVAIATLPTALVAATFGFRPRTLFAADEADRAPVTAEL